MIERYIQILDEFVRHARVSTLYQSPGDIVFSGIALICELSKLEKRKQLFGRLPALDFAACIETNTREMACQWETTAGLVRQLRQHAVGNPSSFPKPDSGHSDVFRPRMLIISKLARMYWCIYADGQGDDIAGSALRELINHMNESWCGLASDYGDEFCLGLGYPHCHPESGVKLEAELVDQLRRTISVRLKEGLQRIEDELPVDYRVEEKGKDERLVTHVGFTWRYGLRNFHSFSEASFDSPCRIATHEDVRLVERICEYDRQKILARLESLADKFEDDELKDFRWAMNLSGEKLLEWLLEQYEQPVTDAGRNRHELLKRALVLGVPLFVRAYLEHVSPSHFLFDGMLSHWPDRKGLGMDRRWRLHWPVYILGKPLFLMSFTLDTVEHPLADDESFSRFMILLQGLMRIQDVAWNVLFDIYHDVLVEIFGDIYLSALRRFGNMGKPQAIAAYIVPRIDSVTRMLAYTFHLPTVRWRLEAGHGSHARNLHELQQEVERSEIRRSDFRISQEEEMRLFLLEKERPTLALIILEPLEATVERLPEKHNMFHHLAWRIGYYVRYQLPELLMTLQYQTQHLLERERAIVRHELGGLLNSSRRILNRLHAPDGDAELEDLSLLMRLMQRTVAATGDAGARSDFSLPDVAMDLEGFFRSLRRLFPSKFVIRTEKGGEGMADIVILPAASNTLLALPISEEDMYGFWRNLWDNARIAIADHTRETPGVERQAKRTAILEKYGPFSMRHRIDELPHPIILAVLYRHAEAEIRLDILDNVPRLAAGCIDYPDEIQLGHYGLGLVYEMARGLSRAGLTTVFRHLRPLDRDTALFYRQQPLLSAYDWDTPEHWSISSLTFGLP